MARKANSRELWASMMKRSVLRTRRTTSLGRMARRSTSRDLTSWENCMRLRSTPMPMRAWRSSMLRRSRSSLMRKKPALRRMVARTCRRMSWSALPTASLGKSSSRVSTCTLVPNSMKWVSWTSRY